MGYDFDPPDPGFRDRLGLPDYRNHLQNIERSLELPSYYDYAKQILNPFGKAAHNRRPRPHLSRPHSSPLRAHRGIHQQQEITEQQKWQHANRWKLVDTFETLQQNTVHLAEEQIQDYLRAVKELFSDNDCYQCRARYLPVPSSELRTQSPVGTRLSTTTIAGFTGPRRDGSSLCERSRSWTWTSLSP